MMLVERWAVATVLGVTMPFVSTAAGSPAPRQAADAQTAAPAKGESSQDPARAADRHDPQAAKDDEEEEKPGTSAYDRDTPPEDQSPAAAEDSQSAKGSQPEKGRDDQNGSVAADNQEKPAKGTESQAVQPSKASGGLLPAAPAELPLAPPPPALSTPALSTPSPSRAGPSTPEQAKDKEQQLQKDSATLLELVQELKIEVEKAGSNTLSLAAVRKADEIQKLAKNLKERLKEQEQTPQNKR